MRARRKGRGADAPALWVTRRYFLASYGRGRAFAPPPLYPLRIPEDPKPAVAVTREDVGVPVLADVGLDAPEVVALRVEVASHLHQLARARVGRWVLRVVRLAPTLDLDRAQAARVVREVGERRILRIHRYLVHREVAEPEGEVLIVRLGDRERVERLERLGIEEPDVAPAVEDGSHLYLLADRPDREVLGVCPRRVERLQAEEAVERLVGGADGDDLVDERARTAEG